ncbi:hypothetical protein COT49_02815 [candidate division WWE3 bacterium CG08_land_8_20_14_0_20_40_13]|uniref:Glycosyltransferase RgtA/B/C/D-like domain-containing protein n=1 Tax=candidate division WWE3 bacterium CG08_land_8_20_14_0_20_40_13 TaxID=1975084 RepID=A0A2H0XFK0_UNCKA|nr:MAG: hypothetical protein COT49_02815 [candidate division WWE3 bacterium CG08_land_8_20_14_0_20_40_13]
MTNIKKIIIEDKFVLLWLLFLVFGSYANSLGNQFVSDDIPGIIQNSAIHRFDYTFAQSWGNVHMFSYFILNAVFGQSPAPFRLVNILFHLGNVVILYFIAKSLHTKKTALLAASIFAVHPILVETITWISGGLYAKLTFFFLLSFLLYIKKETYRHFNSASVISFLACLQSSPFALPLGIIFPLYDLIWKKRLQSLKAYLPIVIGSLIYTGIYFGEFEKRTESLVTTSQFKTGFVNPIHVIPISITEYIKLIFYPKDLTLYHTELSFSKEQFLFRAFLFLIFVSTTIFGFFKSRRYFFWSAWFFISLAVSLNPFGVGWVVAERYVYLGTIGIVVVFSILVIWGIDRVKLQSLYLTILFLLVTPLAIRTIIRNSNWKNQDSLWLSTAVTSPTSAQNHNNLGDYYGRQGNLETAVKEFEVAIKLKPDYADAYHNLANTYGQMERFDEAVVAYQKAIEFNPNLWQSYQNLGVIYYHEKNMTEALKYFETALEINPANENLQLLVKEIRGSTP